MAKKKSKPVSKKPAKTPVTKKVTKSSKPKSKKVVVENNYVNDSTKFWKDFEKDLLHSDTPKDLYKTPNHCSFIVDKVISPVEEPTPIVSKTRKSWFKKWAESMDEATSEVMAYLFTHPLIAGIAISTILFVVVMSVLVLKNQK